MAAMNKSLARSNKSRTGTGATKKRRRPTGSAAQFRGRRPKNNSRVSHEWSGAFIRGWQEGQEPAVWYSCREDLDPPSASETQGPFTLRTVAWAGFSSLPDPVTHWAARIDEVCGRNHAA